jgi:hypothetical protein
LGLELHYQHQLSGSDAHGISSAKINWNLIVQPLMRPLLASTWSLD